MTVWQSSGIVRLQINDNDLAVAHFETAMRLDPMGPDRMPTRWGLTMARFQQGRFAEVAALARQMLQTSENPTSYALLAASLGHLGQPTAAAEALAGYRRYTPQPIDTYARAVWRDPAPRQLFLDGIALAQQARRITGQHGFSPVGCLAYAKIVSRWATSALGLTHRPPRRDIGIRPQKIEARFGDAIGLMGQVQGIQKPRTRSESPGGDACRRRSRKA